MCSNLLVLVYTLKSWSYLTPALFKLFYLLSYLTPALFKLFYLLSYLTPALFKLF